MINCSVLQSIATPGISKKEVREIICLTLAAVKQKDGDITVHFIGLAAMKKLNRQYRGLDRPTDVLSFPMREGFRLPGQSLSMQLGEVFLCPPYIKKQAKRFEVSYREECLRMLTHGVLHLLGYDHVKKKDAKVMFLIQERVLNKCLL